MCQKHTLYTPYAFHDMLEGFWVSLHFIAHPSPSLVGLDGPVILDILGSPCIHAMSHQSFGMHQLSLVEENPHQGVGVHFSLTSDLVVEPRWPGGLRTASSCVSEHREAFRRSSEKLDFWLSTGVIVVEHARKIGCAFIFVTRSRHVQIASRI